MAQVLYNLLDKKKAYNKQTSRGMLNLAACLMA